MENDQYPVRPRRPVAASTLLLAAACVVLAQACASSRGTVHPELTAPGDRHDVLTVSDALEALIDSGRDTPADRQYAYDIVKQNTDDTAPATFARAAVMGRLVQQKGLSASDLVPEIERCGRRSRELDPSFRDGAATRLLGTLYVMAPGVLLEHGNSEAGLEMLEDLAQAHPEVVENHLRLAEAYIALGDPAPANPHLCVCLANQTALRGDAQKLLEQLLDNAGRPQCPVN